MSKKYIYGCVSTVKIGLNDTKAIEKTKAYQAAMDVALRVNQKAGTNLSKEDIYIDVITASYRNRKKLNEIFLSAKPGDVIIIAELSALGFTKEEIKTNYAKIFEKDIELLVFAHLKEGMLISGSTVDCYFNTLVTHSKERLQCMYDIIDDTEINTHQGRKKEKIDLPEHFEEIYWAFENFFIDEKTALANRYFNVSKRRFYEFCEIYEKSPGYLSSQEEQEAEFNISRKPKRYGKVLSKPSNSNGIMLNRLNLKYNNGNSNKSIMAKAAFEYKQKKIIEKFQKTS